MSNLSLDTISNLVDDIANGKLDGQLDLITKALEERRRLIRSEVKLEDFMVGDRVVINERCGTKYLVGELGTVVGIRRTKISIQFDTPKGRFVRKNSDGSIYSSDVIVPLEIVDRKK
jgi:hypothetical protein